MRVRFYPHGRIIIQALATAELNARQGPQLVNGIRRNWSNVSDRVRVTSNATSEGMSISIGGRGVTRRYVHLIEFGGGHHGPQAPTRRAASAAGTVIKWST